MKEEIQMSSKVTEREMFFTRSLAAPRQLVFDVWTKPEHLSHWYGPNGFTITTKQMDMRTGGQWRFTMHGPDGTDYPNNIFFTTVRPPELLEYRQGGEDETEDIEFTVSIRFEEEGQQTKLHMHMSFARPEILRRVIEQYGAYEGAIQHLHRLEAYLMQQTRV